MRYDATSGLMYMRQRWYDSVLGRFISRDPIGIEGGSNLYCYGFNHPVNFTDASGLTPLRSMEELFWKTDRVVRLLRRCGFNEEAQLVHDHYSREFTPWVDDALGFTNPITLGINVKAGLSDIQFMDTAVHEGYHARQGHVRVLFEGVLAKLLRRPKAEYAQEFEVYKAEAAFIVEFMARCHCLDGDDRQYLLDRLNFINNTKLPQLERQYNDWYF